MTLNPETWHCYRGIQKFREIMDLDDEEEINFEEMVQKGVLIYIDDEVVNLGTLQGKRTREPKEISQDISIYVHRDKVPISQLTSPGRILMFSPFSRVFVGRKLDSKTPKLISKMLKQIPAVFHFSSID